MHQQLSLGILFPYLTPDGYYFIEDIGVSPETVKVIDYFLNTRIFQSQHLTFEENKYIEDNTASCCYANGNNILFRKKS